jgi:hypothetical protein
MYLVFGHFCDTLATDAKAVIQRCRRRMAQNPRASYVHAKNVLRHKNNEIIWAATRAAPRANAVNTTLCSSAMFVLN